MKIITLILTLLTFLAKAQTAQLNFVHKNGEIIGKWKVMDLPTSLIPVGTPQGQLLIYTPPAYNQGKKCGLCIWQGGKGENTSLDVTQVYANSLPNMIQNGLVPYSIMPNKDTLWHILVAIHNNFQSSYRAQLSNIIPWILNKSGLIYDKNYVWASGLSEGGAGTWAISCVDSLLSNSIHAIIPMATGGYDNFLSVSAYVTNLMASIKHKLYFIPYIGTQDPSYNELGFLATNAFMKTNANPGQYLPHIIPNGTHSSNVWDVPWKSRIFWDSLGLLLSKNIISIPPNTDLAVHAKINQDSVEINYPNTQIIFTDASYSGSGVLLNSYISIMSYPTGAKPILTPIGNNKVILSGVIPGTYGVKALAFDSATNFVDTAYAYIKVNGPQPCSTIACPPQRKINSFLWDRIAGKVTLIYDNGDMYSFTFSDIP